MELTRHSSCDRSKIPMVENYLNHSYQTATQFKHNFIYSSIRERYNRKNTWRVDNPWIQLSKNGNSDKIFVTSF